MKYFFLTAIIIFSICKASAKMLNPVFEGEVQAFDKKTIQVRSGFHLYTVPRSLIAQTKIAAGDYVKVRLADGTYTYVSDQVKVAYYLKEK